MPKTTNSRSKSANGQGSVRYDRSRQRWLATLTIGWSADGKQRRRKSYHGTEAEARYWLTAQQDTLGAQRRAGINAVELPPVRTVADWLAWWLDKALPGTVSPTTERSYSDLCRLYLNPHVGSIRLTDLQPAHVTSMLRAMHDDGKSANTQRLARAVLARSLKRAETEGLVLRNAARLADAPKLDQTEGRTLDQTQARALLAEIETERYGAAFLLALMLGLRRGEVLGLAWSDLDRDRATLTVRRSLKKVDGRWTPQATKTRGSRRTLFVPAPALDALTRWRATQAEERLLAGPEWSDDPDHDGLMFTSAFGRPVDGSNFRRYLHAATVRAGLGEWNPHELRHSAASLMLAEGVPLKVVSETLGHSSIKVTSDVYGHLLEPARVEAANAMSRALGQPVTEVMS